MKPSQNQLREGVQAVCNHARMQASGPHPLLAVTAQYAAPALYAFCRWVVDTAAARSWQRLYFLSRDGYWMRMLSSSNRRRGLPCWVSWGGLGFPGKKHPIGLIWLEFPQRNENAR